MPIRVAFLLVFFLCTGPALTDDLADILIAAEKDNLENIMFVRF